MHSLGAEPRKTMSTGYGVLGCRVWGRGFRVVPMPSYQLIMSHNPQKAIAKYSPKYSPVSRPLQHWMTPGLHSIFDSRQIKGAHGNGACRVTGV